MKLKIWYLSGKPSVVNAARAKGGKGNDPGRIYRARGGQETGDITACGSSCEKACVEQVAEIFYLEVTLLRIA